MKVRKSIGKVEMSSLRKEMKVEFEIFHWSVPDDNRFVSFIKTMRRPHLVHTIFYPPGRDHPMGDNLWGPN